MKITSVIKSALVVLPALASTQISRSNEVARFNMQNTAGKVTEVCSGEAFEIFGVNPGENVPGAAGKALRFDGYSTYIDAALGNIVPDGSKKMTVSVWFAVETYPIVEIDINTDEQVALATCLNDAERSGFGFFLGFDGRYSFKTYAGGWPLELKVDTPVSRNEWINLTAVVDCDSHSAVLYNNGRQVATSKANGDLKVADTGLRIGRSFNERFSGPFCLTSFNGIIDDITVWNDALDAATIAAWKPENKVDLIVPASRFEGDDMRPSFHGMPSANWTNETHGLTYYDGRYHLFFQKNANGPFMARLHWGHLTSENLCDWTEEQIAIAPGAPYDIKGCWSGCVFSDPQLTNGKPSIIYTGVDYTKAVIAQADPAGNNLISWNKRNEPIINGRPAGLSDDFRDPYFFRTDNGAYIIVGSSKGGVGTATLHAYNPATQSWSNDGKTFFTGSNASTCGTFWEMPNVTKIGDKWIFTVTPQNTSKGVASLYWTGTINADGTFSPDKTMPTSIELNGFARDGFGLLSPTVYQHDGKTIALGIVPDKLPSQANYDLGYAHAYSLPREWTLDNQGNLCQKPFEDISELRQDGAFTQSDFTLNGTLDIDGISGRAIELSGEFSVGNGRCGFSILDDGLSSLKVYYDAANNEIVVDATEVDRLINDSGVFDGFYHSPLPRQLAKGETIKLNIFFDHSILDIFVNETWASSVRVFAKPRAQERVSAFSDAPNQVKRVEGWNLRDGNRGSGIINIPNESRNLSLDFENGAITYANAESQGLLSIYNLSGSKVHESRITSPSGALRVPFRGLYIVTLQTSESMVAKKINF